MSRLVARILLSMFLFPFGAMLYALTEAIGEAAARGFISDFEQRAIAGLLAADVVTWVGVAGYWFRAAERRSAVPPAGTTSPG